jgi:imidazolonepropionase-like amidohydrolase
VKNAKRTTITPTITTEETDKKMENGKRKMENKLKDKSSRLVKFFRVGFLLLTAHCLLLTGSAQSDASQQNKTGKPGTFAITNARIVTVSGATIERGTLVIRDGKIEAVGANVTVPNGAERIDGAGLSVYPGMIDAGTNLGLAEIGGGAPATIDVAETGDMNSNAKAILGINPHSSHVNVTRINGITTVLSMPTGGIVSGQAAIINLNGSTQNEMSLVPAFGLVINFPRITTGGGFNPFGTQQPVDFNEALKRRDQRLEAPAKMAQAGVKFAISTGDNGAMVSELPLQAGLAAAFDLPKDEALKSVTLYPAQILGIADRLGSLETGKVANIVITNGDILEPRTSIRYVFINGRLLPLTSRHTELYDSFKDRK